MRISGLPATCRRASRSLLGERNPVGRRVTDALQTACDPAADAPEERAEVAEQRAASAARVRRVFRPAVAEIRTTVDCVVDYAAATRDICEILNFDVFHNDPPLKQSTCQLARSRFLALRAARESPAC